MDNVLKEKILSAFKDKKINLESVILNDDIDLNDEEFLFLLINMYENKIHENREINEINYKNINILNPILSQSTKEIIQEYNEMDLDETNSIIYTNNGISLNITKILLTECIKNIRFGIEFSELFQEMYISYLELNEKVFSTLKIKDEKLLEFVISQFIRKEILLYQKNVIMRYKNIRLSHILYSTIENKVKNESELNDYLTKNDIDLEYYEILKNQYKDDILSEEEIEEETENILESYNEALYTSKINYIEEIVIMIYLKLVDNKNAKEKIKELNIDSKRFKNLVKETIYKLALYEPNDVMDFYLGKDKVIEEDHTDIFEDYFDEEYDYEEDEDHHHHHHHGCTCGHCNEEE